MPSGSCWRVALPKKKRGLKQGLLEVVKVKGVDVSYRSNEINEYYGERLHEGSHKYEQMPSQTLITGNHEWCPLSLWRHQTGLITELCRKARVPSIPRLDTFISASVIVEKLRTWDEEQA
ncbi:hypothetical protein HAX54_014602 [Datura stramonium]|uniref:Uncharacterized protein n=1 Tax=Datura stramonium TaxID=4076 RepID=A0ABS8RYV5_DATST|nr:hypothetical protein [Datura stramonium]